MKNFFGLFAPLMLLLMLCLSCSSEYSYDYLDSVEQSGGMICIVKKRLATEYKVVKPITKAEIFYHGTEVKSQEFPDLTVRSCSSINEKMMSLVADDGVYLWIAEPREDGKSDFNLKKLNVQGGNLSNDLQWYVTENSRINVLTGEEIFLKANLPSTFLGNSPDWKTIITEGQNLVEQDLISLYVVDTETGVAKQRFVRRANYLFMLNHAHVIAGIIADNIWISNQFRWLPDANGKFQLVYPVLEPEENKKEQKK